MIPGPNQEKWLQALESGKYKQGKNSLCIAGKYCCLGVACDVFETPVYERYYDDEDDEAGGVIIYGTEGYHTGGVAPLDVQDKLKLYTSAGNPSKGGVALVGLNDEGRTFKEIAALIRKDPSNYFKEPN